MTHEARITIEYDGVLRVGDDPDRLQAILQRSMDGGRFDGDELRIGIPIDRELAYFGTSEWHITEDGKRVGKANVLFGAYLSEVTGRDIVIHDYAPVEDERDQFLRMATVRD